jgi:hypothetical protein
MKGDREKAYRYFGLSVDVTKEMAQMFITALTNKGVQCIIAPYEADRQLILFILLFNLQLYHKINYLL